MRSESTGRLTTLPSTLTGVRQGRLPFPGSSLRLERFLCASPEALIENLKLLANKRDVPYQSLLKIFLAERIEREARHTR